ncbi:histone-lysine N-methyltransferase SETMAR [Trichonephila clavipes]|nr:histone-lysine N-methyltransferase SETMAR [Trichonephila clavipes]
MFKEGRDSVEDEPFAGHPSASRTAENEQQRCCRLGICAQRTDSQWCLLRGSVKKIGAIGKPIETRNFRLLEAPPRQCAISHLLLGYRALDKKWHRNNSTASLHPRPCPADFFLFPKVKTVLKGHLRGTLDDVKRACTHALKGVSLGDFQAAYEAWKRRLQKCGHAQGAFFEDY